MKSRWYKNAVIYQIYPRSFADSNGDGIGDLKGIISKLDYIKDLGVDAVWLSPCYESPNDDNGYDISNYRDILPEFGTIADWCEMREGLHSRGIKLVMDLVANHTSDEHPWFIESKKSKDNPYRDYYIWQDPKGDSRPPNNWSSRFVGSAWTLDATTNQHYLHLFSKKQPDLNWDNPKVRQEVVDICDFWFDLGVDGFRCDVINYISKPQDMRNSKAWYSPVRGDDVFSVGENWYKYINEMCVHSWDKRDSYIVGECTGKTINRAPKMIAEAQHRLDSIITFEHMDCDSYFGLIPHKLNLKRFKKIFSDWQLLPKSCSASLYLENHDQPRVVSRYGNDSLQYRGVSAKMLATMLFFLRGTPYIYQGQELGMTNCPFALDEFNDILSVNVLAATAKIKPLQNFAHKVLSKKGRDNARTPMQWNASEGAGFTTGIPWTKINPNHTFINVEESNLDQESVLNYYKSLIKARKANQEIINNGDYICNYPKSNFLYSYTIKDADNALLVICNFSSSTQKFVLPKGLQYEKSTLIISNNAKASPIALNCKLLAYEARVYLLQNE